MKKLCLACLAYLVPFSIHAAGGIEKTLSGKPLSWFEIIFGGAVMIYIFILRSNR